MASPRKATKSKTTVGQVIDRTPLLEWVAAAVGLMLTLGAIGYLAWTGVQPRQAVPDIAATAGAVHATAGGYVVEVEISNRNRETAAGVEVEGVLSNGAGEVETSAITLDYLPGLGRRSAALVFQNDPRRFGLKLAPKGHLRP